MSRRWQLRPATSDDVEWLADLRAVALHDSLIRVGRFDEHRVRDRFRQAFRSECTQVVVVDGADAGCVALRTDGIDYWLEHFYLPPGLQGQGIGGEIVAWAIEQAAGRTLRLSVLEGSPAQRLYERHGFVADGQDDVDVLMSRR